MVCVANIYIHTRITTERERDGREVKGGAGGRGWEGDKQDG